MRVPRCNRNAIPARIIFKLIYRRHVEVFKRQELHYAVGESLEIAGSSLSSDRWLKAGPLLTLGPLKDAGRLLAYVNHGEATIAVVSLVAPPQSSQNRLRIGVRMDLWISSLSRWCPRPDSNQHALSDNRF